MKRRRGKRRKTVTRWGEERRVEKVMVRGYESERRDG
jgi:hypothetical protein